MHPMFLFMAWGGKPQLVSSHLCYTKFRFSDLFHWLSITTELWDFIKELLVWYRWLSGFNSSEKPDCPLPGANRTSRQAVVRHQDPASFKERGRKRCSTDNDDDRLSLTISLLSSSIILIAAHLGAVL